MKTFCSATTLGAGYALWVLALLFSGKKAHAQITFSLNGQNNFVITCSNPTLSLSAVGNFTAPVTYTLVSSQQLTVSAGSTCSVSSPGNYTLYVGSGSQITPVPLAIMSDTQVPGISISAPARTLTCDVPTVQLQAGSSTQSVNFSWAWSSPSPTMSPGGAIAVSANFATPSATMQGTYSATATNTVNGCSSSTVIPIWQNVVPPNAIITPSAATLTCNTASINLANFSTSGNPPNSPFPFSMPVISYLWLGPEGAPTKSNSSSYLATLPGTYTMFVKDMNNGCTSCNTITITDSRIFPVFNQTAPFFLNCPGTVTLGATMSSTNTIVSWQWAVPAGANVSGINTPVLTTNAPGYYTLTATNNAGCSSKIVMEVYACTGLDETGHDALAVKLFPNPAQDHLSLRTESNTKVLNLSICNALGQLVYKQEIQQAEQEIDLGALTPGVYMITLRGGSAQKTMKVIKE